MKNLLHIVSLITVFAFAQPTSEGMYFDGIDDILIVPNTSNINQTITNNRTYETYFKVNSTSSRQVLMKEGGGIRAVTIYIENGYLVLGAYNRADYSPNWEGTFYRKAISANTWYHLALVFDNALPANNTGNPMNATANTSLKFYLDGILEADNSGYQLGGHNSIRLGYKNETLRFPNCGSWGTASGSAEYCFGNLANDNMNGTPNGEYYFQGNLWGFRVWNDVRTSTELNDKMNMIITSVGTDDLVAALDGDTLTFLNSSNNSANVNNPNSTIISWSSTAGSSDWNIPSNWAGGIIPDSAKHESAIIVASTNPPIINAHVIAGDVEVMAGAEIIIQPGGTLDVEYDMLNEGTVTIENNGSLLIRESKEISGTGTYIVKRDTPNYPIDDFYSIWSTPIVEADSQIGNIFTNNVVMFEYDASQNPSAYVGVTASENMEVGKGYFIKSDDDNGVLTRTFTGTVNNGDIDEPIYFNSNTDNFNLIGNPYPSAINWLTFHKDNSELIEGTMFFWSQSVTGVNNSTSDFISYNSTGSNIPGTTGDIGAGQGVFVKSSQTGTATFRNTHRIVGDNNQFFRNSDNPDDGKSWFKLSGDTGFSSILVGFIPLATEGYDGDYDGEFVNEGASIEFYSFIEGNKYSIQGRPELEDGINEEVPLGLEVTTAGTYTISIFQEYINPDFDIILDDTQENVQTNLRSNGYTFNVSSPTEINDRFILRYNYNAVLGISDNLENSNEVKAYFDHHVLVSSIGNSSRPNNLDILNISGQLITNATYTDRVSMQNLPTGIYIVRYYFDDHTITRKVLKINN